MTKARQPEAYTSLDGGPFSPVDVRVVATWPVGSFAENLAVHPDGSVFVSLYTPQRIDRYDPISGRTNYSQICPRRAWGWLSTPRALSGRRVAHFRKDRATSGEWLRTARFDYVQHHFSQDHWAHLWPLPDGIRRMDVVLDGAVEVGFANIDGRNRYAEASPVLFGDLFHLFEHTVAHNLPQGSRTLVYREADGIPNGPDRLYRLHLHLNGGSGNGFRPWLSEWAQHLASAPTVQKLRLHLPEPYDNAHPAPPSPFVDNQVSDERKDIGVIEIGFASALTAREFWESEAYRATVEEQRGHLRSVGAFLVTGIYTYVRDGVITTAGLRGSGTAELIERIGAINQTQDEVTRRFVQDPNR